MRRTISLDGDWERRDFLDEAWRWSDALTFYGAVDNLNNEAPPTIASTGGGNLPNTQAYDGLGRVFRIGVRLTH